jgi:hypothetical protein
VHALGKFLIQINFSKDYTKLFNLSWRRKGFDGWGYCHSPHIQSNGSPCYGTVGVAVEECKEKYDLFSLGLTLVEFVKSINEDDGAGKYLFNWPLILDGKILMNYLTTETHQKMRSYFASNGKPMPPEEVLKIAKGAGNTEGAKELDLLTISADMDKITDDKKQAIPDKMLVKYANRVISGGDTSPDDPDEEMHDDDEEYHEEDGEDE